MAVIVDSSVFIDYLEGERIEAVVQATTEMNLILSPLVIAELLSGDLTVAQREFIGELLQDFALHNPARPLD